MDKDAVTFGNIGRKAKLLQNCNAHRNKKIQSDMDESNQSKKCIPYVPWGDEKRFYCDLELLFDDESSKGLEVRELVYGLKYNECQHKIHRACEETEEI